MKRVASAVAVAVGRGVERALTGRAALAYYRTLLGSTTDPEARVEAVLAAIRVAMGLGDKAAIGELGAVWATIPDGFGRDEAVRLCRELVNAGMTAEAAVLAGAEVARHRTAMSLYLWARCSEGTEDAPGRYAQTIERAEREGARHIVDAARRRRAVLLAGRWETLPEAVREAATIDLQATPPSERLAVVGVLFASPSRFVRATAIGVLDELVLTERRDTRLAAQALRAAARFADAMGDALTSLETERLKALFGRPYALAMAPRAREVMNTPRATADAGSARTRLGVAHAALLAEDAVDRDAAIALFAEHLRAPTVVAPPSGWSALAHALALAGATELAATARHAAAAAREPGAVDALGLALAREGWKLAETDPVAAIAKLREAKRAYGAG